MILSEAGADQTARDKTSNNVLHRLLRRMDNVEAQLQEPPGMPNLIDKRLASSLYVERCADYPPLPQLTGIILDRDPTSLNRESTTGRTPFELAKTQL